MLNLEQRNINQNEVKEVMIDEKLKRILKNEMLKAYSRGFWSAFLLFLVAIFIAGNRGDTMTELFFIAMYIVYAIVIIFEMKLCKESGQTNVELVESYEKLHDTVKSMLKKDTDS